MNATLPSTSARRERPAQRPVDPRVGHVVGGFRVVERIGAGASSRVYRAVDDAGGVEVALKVLLPELTASRGRVNMFLREVELLERLSPSHFVRVVSSGQEGGDVFIAFELVTGGSLQDLLRSDVRFSATYVARVARGVAAGLVQMEREGIVHRDVKPANLLFAAGGDIRIVDLGVAADLRVDDAAGRVGSPRYMAPEQSMRLSVDHRADLYSLGVVLYEMLSRVDDSGSELRSSLARLVDRLMASRREQRPSSADEVLCVLRDSDLRSVA